MAHIELPTLHSCYERRMNWYPEVQRYPTQVRELTDLAAIADRFDLIMLDVGGVLFLGEHVMEGAVQTVQQLRRSSCQVCVVSNDTMHTGAMAAQRYQKSGFDLSEQEVVTSLDVVLSWLPSVQEPHRYAVMAPASHSRADHWQGMVNLNERQGEIPDSVDRLLFLAAAGWTDAMQETLVSSARGRSFELVIGNPDVGAPWRTDDQFILYATPGYFLDNFVTRTEQQAKPLLLGKPGPAPFELAATRWGVTDPSRVLMVGDTLHTDIVGATAMGYQSLLLGCGVYRQQQTSTLITESGISPSFVAHSL